MKKMIFTMLLSLVFLVPFEASAAADIKAPVVEEIKILTPNVKPGEKLRVELKISDDSAGLEYVRALFFSPSYAHNIFPILYVKEGEPLTNTYILESDFLMNNLEMGKWTLDLVQTKDYNQNIGNYGKNDSAIVRNISFNFGTTNVAPTTPAPKQENDGFKALKEKKNIALDGELTFTFNANVDNRTILKKNIYVLNEKGENIPLLFIVEKAANGKSSTITLAPVNNYERNSVYTVYIKDIYAKNGKVIKQYTKTKFTTIK